ncbi:MULTISPECIES: dimethylamine monooxygenase subunit DmmA family protein [Nitrincola]|uniref:Dimethylamine monooxygenase subunit DmmA-like C-terminal domain-containing protein n=1 Tax=Nitrincola nitratireducens TaxID=1229521 RepID=W9VA84_9GAMM|nr:MULTISPECIES: dimethylamine monooxygenase subunit DmmA family protein [Nitrincola]EXJ12957.1 hypothetical protein D791_00300 [Nitrincola nitratireducens]
METECQNRLPSQPSYAQSIPKLSSRVLISMIQDAEHPKAIELLSMVNALPVSKVLTNIQWEAGVIDPVVSDALHSTSVGSHLAICGDERFIWACWSVASQAGWLNDEMTLLKTEDVRNLYCVHCGHIQAISTQTEAECQSCQVQLFVRDHFSQRLGAYMGVCLDANQPYGGEVK